MKTEIVALALLAGTLAGSAVADQSSGEFYTDITFGGGGLGGRGVLDGYLSSNGEFQIVSARGSIDSLPFTLAPSLGPYGNEIDNILYTGPGGYAGTGFPFDDEGLGLTTSKFTLQLACGSDFTYYTACVLLGPPPYVPSPGLTLLNFSYTPPAALAPEPPALSLLCLGVAALGLARWMRNLRKGRALFAPQ